ncbi:hypothetical protein AYI68_g36 [Smittium mucronatum]|uniref:Uncharacterized protein n=1 Tax=Smittium mucronatum TaxID=133383 RepID=A0A1R0H9A3_9FUNG|nr:hypothetical protein AYI68_g36 [Smittium mucronatum]
MSENKLSPNEDLSDLSQLLESKLNLDDVSSPSPTNIQTPTQEIPQIPQIKPLESLPPTKEPKSRSVDHNDFGILL